MNRLLKSFLTVSIAVIVILAILFAVLKWSFYKKRQQANIDGKIYSEKCDSVAEITESHNLMFSGFNIKEIDTLYFKIKRDGKEIKDSVLTQKDFNYISGDSNYMSMPIPYKTFFKKDTIMLKTKTNLHYCITGFHHFAYLHYGMFGYLGSYDCRLSDNFTINNVSNTNCVDKLAGWIDFNPLKERRIIYAGTKEFDSIVKLSSISDDKAWQMAIDKTKCNRYKYLTTFLGIEQKEDYLFYLFREKLSDSKSVTVKINTKTGKYKRLRD